jgi:hypothetical protein
MFGRLFDRLRVRAAVIGGSVQQAGVSDSGITAIAPTLTQYGTELHARQMSERTRQAKQYIAARDDYFKKRAGARIIGPTGIPCRLDTLDSRREAAAKLRANPHLARSEAEIASGIAVPHRSVAEAQRFKP